MKRGGGVFPALSCLSQIEEVKDLQSGTDAIFDLHVADTEERSSTTGQQSIKCLLNSAHYPRRLNKTGVFLLRAAAAHTQPHRRHVSASHPSPRAAFDMFFQTDDQGKALPLLSPRNASVLSRRNINMLLNRLLPLEMEGGHHRPLAPWRPFEMVEHHKLPGFCADPRTSEQGGYRTPERRTTKNSSCRRSVEGRGSVQVPNRRS